MKPRLSTILWWNLSSQCAVVGSRTQGQKQMAPTQDTDPQLHMLDFSQPQVSVPVCGAHLPR